MIDEIVPPDDADNHAAQTESIDYIEQSKEHSTDDILRIENDVVVYWTGVTGCCGSDRINPEVTAAFNQWVQQKKDANPTRIFLRAGAPSSSVNCRSWGGGPFGDPRKCTGRTVLKAWAEFA